MIGIGNVVGIAMAVQLGGPGALFWVWMAALVGSIIKYSEVFLGLKHRVPNDQGGFDGGPMYFLRRAFQNRWLPGFAAILLCIYGIEIYQFSVVTESLSTNYDLNRYLVIGGLLFVVLYASMGGIARLGTVCSWLMPVLITIYLSMCLWIIFQELAVLPALLNMVFVSAFNGHAAIGGFAGSTMILAVQYGISKAAYSADIGVGYDSIIQSESSTIYPERQARLAVLGVCIDNLICTISILVVLITGVWQESIEGSHLVQTALSHYFPYMHLFMPILLFILGYTTMIAYFCIGIKCARFLSPRYGFSIYVIYGAAALLLFSFFDQTKAAIVMSIAQAFLLITNLLAIFKLRHELSFAEIPYEATSIASVTATEAR